MLKLDDLKSRNRIFGVPSIVDEFLNPSEEREMEDSPFDSQDPVKAVAGVVVGTAEGRVIQIESDDNYDDDSGRPSVIRSELSALCQRIETGYLQYGNPQVALNSSELLCKYRGRGAAECKTVSISILPSN